MANLVVKNVTRRFATRGEPLMVLNDVSLTLEAAQNAAIIGPSGCGKSTLLHVIGTLDRPDAGKVTLDGEDPFTLPEPKLAEFRNRRIGFVFQDHHLLPQCTVLENVLLPVLAGGSPDKTQIERARELIGRVGLSAREDHRPAELSGGERQRAAVARALINGPTLLLADEPTGNLDRTSASAVGQLLLEVQQTMGTMLLVVTHSAELAALFSRRLTIDAGRIAPVA